MLTLYINPSTYFRMHRSKVEIPPFASLYSDSFLLASLSSLFGINIERRCFDFSNKIGDAAPVFSKAGTSSKFLFVGGTVDEAAAFERLVCDQFNLTGKLITKSGFSNDIVKDIDGLVRLHNPTHIILGLGAPLQEKVAIHFHYKYPMIDVRTCGGFITQTSMNKGEFYPPWVQRFGLRWLYRFFRQPKVIPRVLFEYPSGVVWFLRWCKFSGRFEG